MSSIDNHIINDKINYVGIIRFNQQCHNWLSHKYICNITIDNIKYNSVEQYLIFKKAELFNDERIMKAVMIAMDPLDMHYLGRRIENYVDEDWVKIRGEVSYIGNKHKFLQNPDLYKKLFETKFNKLIYYADDLVWGCNPDDKGENLLGKTIMRVRENDMLSMTNIYFYNKYNDFAACEKSKYIVNEDDYNFCEMNNIDFFIKYIV
uniref:NADAR domain-containing protein n=1 Tax=viral metagenome TaxID=1070528 RepID=A0A6C0D8M0_9ZZZZ